VTITSTSDGGDSFKVRLVGQSEHAAKVVGYAPDGNLAGPPTASGRLEVEAEEERLLIRALLTVSIVRSLKRSVRLQQTWAALLVLA
jgi:hypothetical protein